jgi:[ribosomal protein S5]-alanine N-acetyltransferase
MLANPKDFPILEIDDKFYLREQRLSDLEDFYKYFANKNVAKYILSSIPENIDQAREEIIYWIDLFYKNIGIYWAIADKKTDKMIGAVGYHDFNRFNNRAEISYDLSEDYWQQGIMSKAMNVAIEYAFNKLLINRIQASTIKENIASIKILEKCNFKFDGTLDEFRFHKGRYYDIEMYSLTKSRYKNG